MKKISVAVICSLAFTFAAKATVTLQFSSIFAGGIASNFANASGTPTNGMIYGVIVDTSGNGFATGNYQPFTLADGYLSTSSGVTDDYFALSSTGSTTTTDTSAFTESPSTSSGGPGTINLVSGVPYGNLGTSSLDAGDSFLLVWFATSSATAGSAYGVLGNNAFIIPADGATTSFDSVFLGADPIRSATFTVTPEPTSFTLALAAGVVGMLRRRRRA